MAILACTQQTMKDRRRFKWQGYKGSIYVVNEGGGWGWIGVSSKQLIDLATQIIGQPDEKARNGLDHTYTTWSEADPYQLADLLYQADKICSK